MRSNMMRILAAAVPLSVLLVQPLTADTINGKLNGHDCAHAGVTCAIDPKDPHIALEADFVLQQKDGDYVFLTNLPREVKLKHVLQEAQVDGVMSRKFNSMVVDRFKIRDGDGWKTVWNREMLPKINLEIVQGRLNGHECVHAGITCPLDPEDPHILVERDFVLQKEDGDYMFLTNLPRSTKLQYVLKDIRVSGVVDTKYNTIEVHELMIMDDDEWKTVWFKRE
jgi:hypothetical protein